MKNKSGLFTSTVAFGTDVSARKAVLRDDLPFRILVIGNLGAATSYDTPVLIDCEDLDKVIAQLQVHTRVQLNAGDQAVEIPFRKFDDFHPDQLCLRLGIFESLRTRRKRLLNESTSRQEIAAIINSKVQESGDTKPDVSGTNSFEKSAPDNQDLLSDILNITHASQKPLEQQVLEGNFDWDTYVRQLVAPYAVDKADPRQAELVAGIDSVIADTMRSILHSPEFQQLEASWQGIRFLTQRLETGRELQLSVMHIAPDDFEADLLNCDDLSKTKFYKLLMEDVSAGSANPWGLVVADFLFGMTPVHCEVLARIARICEAAGTQFVSGASPEIAGCEDFTKSETPAEVVDPCNWTSHSGEELERWNSLRNHTSASRIILALPRLMARRPYGPDSDSIEAFAFNEIPDGSRLGQYLWMNAAFGIAVMLGQNLGPDDGHSTHSINPEIERVPVHIFERDGEEVLQPGAEVILSQRAAEKFAQFGLTVLRGARNEDIIRVAMIRSLNAIDNIPSEF